MSCREKKQKRDKITAAGDPPTSSVPFPGASPPRRTVPGPRRVSLAVYSGLLDLEAWAEICPRNDWAPYLEAATQEEEWLARIREATQSGKPVGSKLFVDELERQAGQRLELRPRGRPRKHLAARAASN